MRNMSFAHTREQILAETKDVTRRRGWLDLKEGEVLQAVYKSQGLKKGEKAEKLKVIRVKSVRRERLFDITQEDVAREGFPGMTPSGFVEMFTASMKCHSFEPVTRIEFKYVDIQSVERREKVKQGLLFKEAIS